MTSKRKTVLLGVSLLLSMLSALFFVQFLGGTSFGFGPFHLVAQARLTTAPGTTVKIPPFGEVEALTHKTPVGIQVTLMGLDLDSAKDYVKSPSPQAMVLDDARRALPALVLRFTLKALLLGLLGGMLPPLILGLRRLTPLIAGAAVGLSIVALLGGLTAANYEQTAFQRPTYRGVLSAAPWVVGLIEKSWDQVDQLGVELETVATNLGNLSTRVGQLGPLSAPDAQLVLLHVSDIHNNPAAVQFIRELVSTFGVNAVIDTGDLTDFGTSLEEPLISGIDTLGVPYFWVPGNHDSPELIDALRRRANIRVLDGKVRTFKGLTIAGVADPASDTNNPDVHSDEALQDSSRQLADLVGNLPRLPDIVAVHNPKTAASVLGKVPLVLAGHTHSLKVAWEKGTLLVNAGTSGAAGVRGLQGSASVPYTLALLYFQRDPDTSEYTLQTVDTIRIDGRSGGFVMERILVPPERNKMAERRID